MNIYNLLSYKTKISNMFSRSDIIVISAIILSIIIFTPQMIIKHERYASFAWDLGTFYQALKSTLEGKFMYHTVQLYVLPSGNHMLIHFTPILLFLLPIFAIVPYVTTLLVIKSVVTFVAAYPLYLLSKRLSDNLTALLISFSYMLYPLLHGSLLFDFQFSIFFPLFLFMSVYAYISNRKILYFLSIALLALVSEQGALYAFVISVIHTIPYILNYAKRFKPYLSWLFIDARTIKFKYILLILVITLAYYLSVANFIEYSVSNYTVEELEERLKAYPNFEILGYKGNALLIPFYAITNPNETLNAFTYEYTAKLIFIVLVYGLLIFLPLQSAYGLFSLPFISTFLLSNFSAYYKFGGHYPQYYIGFIFLGFAMVVTRIDKLKNRVRILSGVIIITVLMLVNFAPWSPTSTDMINLGLVWYPPFFSEKDERMKSLDVLVDIANKEGLPILTQNHIFTHTLMTPDTYVVPPYELYIYNTTYFDNYIQDLITRTDLILLDVQDDPMASLVLDYALDDFGVYAEGHNAVLLKRGYDDESIIINEECRGMLFNPNAEPTDNSIMLPKGREGFLVYGPYRLMFNGNYTITFEIRANNIDNFGAIGMIDISSDLGSTVYSNYVISGYELRDNKWYNITLPFSLDALYKRGMEFRLYSLGNSDLEFKRCIIERTDTSGGNVGILAENLKFNAGFKNGNMVTLYDDIKTDLFWYGPNILINKGVYLAEIYLKIEPEPTDDIITIDIVYDNRKSIARSIVLDNDTLTYIGDDWYIANIPFVLSKDINVLEIIGRYPNNDYNISISHINIKGI